MIAKKPPEALAGSWAVQERLGITAGDLDEQLTLLEQHVEQSLALAGMLNQVLFSPPEILPEQTDKSTPGVNLGMVGNAHRRVATANAILQVTCGVLEGALGRLGRGPE